jgi:O-antigen/teichoic acid export membrane protein
MLEYGCYPLLLFIATPWFLHRLGTEQYGHWMLLTATVAFGGVLNTGTGAATIKAVSAGIGRAAHGETERAVRTSLGIAMLGGAALALLVFAIFWFAGGTLLARMGDPALIGLTGAIAALLIWLEQLDNVFSSAMKGAEHFGQAARVEIASKTVQIIVAALVLLPWPGLWALYVALVLVAILRLLAKAAIARRLLALSDLRPSLKRSGDILHFAKWGWLQGMGGVLFGVADRILVGSLLGAASLAYYSIASQLAMQIHAASAAGLSVIFPMVSRKLEARDHFSLRSMTKLIMAANLLFSSALAIALLLFGQELLVFWLGPASAAPVIQVLPYLVLAYWLLALNVTPHYILLSLGRIRFVAISNLVAGSVLILVVSMIATTYGLVGVAFARSLYGMIIVANLIPLVHGIRRAEHI